jgi:hypothetical protein
MNNVNKIGNFLTLFIHNYNYLPYADFKAAANFDFFSDAAVFMEYIFLSTLIN